MSGYTLTNLGHYGPTFIDTCGHLTRCLVLPKESSRYPRQMRNCFCLREEEEEAVVEVTKGSLQRQTTAAAAWTAGRKEEGARGRGSIAVGGKNRARRMAL